MSTQQGHVPLSTDWQKIYGDDARRALLAIQNRSAAVLAYYYFGAMPSDADALELEAGGMVWLDTFVPDGALWMRADASTTEIVVLMGAL